MKGMKMLFLGIAILIVLLLIAGFVRGGQSQTPPELGLIKGHLQACPDKPNCVCSESEAVDKVHAIAPFAIADWQALRQAVEGAGGKIVFDGGRYLHATFTSAVFRFVDDVELRLDVEQGLVHIRSASRVGHSDFGVNRKRVEAIRARMGVNRP